jgi:hypothetical protein
MRGFELLRLIAIVTCVATLPVVAAAALYSQTMVSSSADGFDANGELLFKRRPDSSGPVPAPGQNVVTSDGHRIGAVTAVRSSAAGRTIHVFFRAGGVFGVGARTVAISSPQFAVIGQDVHLNMTAASIADLPSTTAAES